MAFRDDLKRSLGYPLVDVELEDLSNNQVSDDPPKDDFEFIMKRTLRIVREYHPMEHIVRKSVPTSGTVFGQGFLDVSDDGFMNISDVYVIVPVQDRQDVLLPWSIARIWEQVWVGKSDFAGFDILLYQNAIRSLQTATNTVFDWKYYAPEQKVYIQNVPVWATGIGIRGMKGISSLDDLHDLSALYEYALKYATGVGKQKIGIPMRKFSVNGIEMPGQDYINEGKEEEKDALEWIEETAVYPGGMST